VFGCTVVCGGPWVAREVRELVEPWVDADEGEVGLDDEQVEFPDVLEDAAHPGCRVVPALAGGARCVVAAVNGGEHGWRAGGHGPPLDWRLDSRSVVGVDYQVELTQPPAFAPDADATAQDLCMTPVVRRAIENVLPSAAVAVTE
jgi:hypothetical protein